MLAHLSLPAQLCPPATPTNGVILSGNNYRAMFKADGNPLTNLSGELRQLLEYDDPVAGQIATIFAQGIWLGGITPTGEIRIAAEQYGQASGDATFTPGPVSQNGEPLADNCTDFDRAWGVRRLEIEAHLADYSDNQVIDNPIPAVMGWPGRGNPSFATYNGFELPDNGQDYAPFMDVDGNGSYNPARGDYPVEPKQQRIAEHLVWTVSNTTNSATNFPFPDPFPVELHTTAWAFECTDNEVLNDAIFVRYSIFHRDTVAFDSVRFGLWTDFDLGCYTDDYFGTDTLSNSFYTYNRDNDDNVVCEQFGDLGFGINPPVQSVTYLNQELSSLTGSVTPVESPLPLEQRLYYSLTGRWPDGRSLQLGGDGYDEGNAPVVNHLFSGNPNDPTSWALANTGFDIIDSRTVAATNVGYFGPGSTFTLDVAYAYHRAPDSNHLQNVNVMLENVAALQSLYDTGWENNCSPTFCEEECVYPGDLNADGIANYIDLVALHFGWGATGPQRTGPHIWAPRPGGNWAEEQPLGPNQKHLDGNGDGTVNELDYKRTLDHYNLTHDGYENAVVYNEGPELRFFAGSINNPDNVLNPGQPRIGRVYVISSTTDLRAVTFELEYDTAFFDQFRITSSNDFGGAVINYGRSSGVGLFACVAVESEPNFPLGDAISSLRFSMVVRDDFPPDFPAEPTRIRFRNVRGWLADGTEIEIGGTDAVIDIEGVTVTVKEPTWAGSIRFYPNPVGDVLTLELNDAPVESITVHNTLGQTVLAASGPTRQLNTQALVPGTYFLRLRSGGEVVTRKFLKR